MQTVLTTVGGVLQQQTAGLETSPVQSMAVPAYLECCQCVVYTRNVRRYSVTHIYVHHCLGLIRPAPWDSKIICRKAWWHSGACLATDVLSLDYGQSYQLSCCDNQFHNVQSLCRATKQFSLPWSDLTQDGSPYKRTASKRSHKQLMICCCCWNTSCIQSSY